MTPGVGEQGSGHHGVDVGLFGGHRLGIPGWIETTADATGRRGRWRKQNIQTGSLGGLGQRAGFGLIPVGEPRVEGRLHFGACQRAILIGVERGEERRGETASTAAAASRGSGRLGVQPADGNREYREGSFQFHVASRAVEQSIARGEEKREVRRQKSGDRRQENRRQENRRQENRRQETGVSARYSGGAGPKGTSGLLLP